MHDYACTFVGSTLNLSASHLFTFAMYRSTEKEDNKKKTICRISFLEATEKYDFV